MGSVVMGGSFRRVSRQLRQALAERLRRWASAIGPEPAGPPPLALKAAATAPGAIAQAGAQQESAEQDAAGQEAAELQEAAGQDALVPPAAPAAEQAEQASPLAHCPAMREPVSIEEAVLERSMAVLRREAADSLAALGAAHALVSSARLSQLQQVQQQLAAGAASREALMTLAADYHGWQSDQVRIFDALALILRMRIPQGTALEQVGGELQQQARGHLSSLAVEYQRGLLNRQFQPPERDSL